MNYVKLWKEVAEMSDNFSSTILIKNKLAHFATSHDAIREAFTYLQAEEYNRAMRSVRIFNDYNLSSKAIQALIRSSPLPDESIAGWMQRVIGTDESFIIFNNAERYSEQIAKSISSLNEALNEQYPFDCMVMEANLILGKYGLTPLGIHYDNPLGDWHKVLQINLGPGKKKMHFWERNAFQELMQSTSKNHFVSKEELATLLPHAETFEMEEGDALFFSPEDYYHIADSSDFSISLGLVLFNETRDKFQKDALNTFVNDAFSDEQEPVAKGDKDHFLVASNTLRSAFPEQHHWIDQALSDARKKYASNKYLRVEPSAQPFPYASLEAMNGKKIELNQPFQISYQQGEGTMDIFIRGRKLMLISIPGLDQLIDQLNAGKRIEVQEVYDLFSLALDDEAILFILTLLYENRGIIIS